ncbi:MAG: hypothetical protein H6Q65_397 [Firmicutes bacterium]|nr:hypothetical protein [Bacillota bacterium]
MILEAGGAAIAGVLLTTTALRCYRRRNPARQLCHLTKKTANLADREPPLAPKEAASLLLPIYSIIRKAFVNKNETEASQGISLLKNCVSAGWLRHEEPENLKWLALEGLRCGQANNVSQVVDILCMLPARSNIIDLQELSRLFIAVGIAALKEKENFIAAKATDGIFTILLLRKKNISAEVVQVCLQGLKEIGVLALNRHDIGLFREIVMRLTEWAVTKNGFEAPIELTEIFSVWLHAIVAKEDEQGLEVVTDFFIRFISDRNLPVEKSISFLQEWLRFAGIASLNPGNVLAPMMMFSGLDAAVKKQNLPLWILAVSAAGQIPARIIQTRGITKAFPVLYPLLESGRILLGNELKFGGEGYGDSYRQQALLVIINETLILLNLGAQQDLISTPDEILAEVRNTWLNYSPACFTRKQAQRYCQLLYYYWRQTKCKPDRHSKNTERELLVPLRLSEQDRQRLKFLA